MPIQNLFTEYLDQQENSAVFNNLSQKEEGKLLVTNRLLEILIADVEDLLRSIECEKGLAFDQPDLHARGEMRIQNNQVDKQCINCMNIPCSAQLNLNIKEGHINCDNNDKDMLNKYCKAILSSQQSDPHARGEISSENNQVDQQSINCKNILCSAQSNLSIKEGHISYNNNHIDMLSKYCKAVLSSQQSDSSLKGQISLDNNQKSLFVSTGFWIIPSCKQSDFSIKGQTSCENIQEDEGLLNIDSITVSISKQPDSNIKEQIIFENSQDNSLKMDCKIGSSSENFDSIIKGQINFLNNRKNLLKIDCKTGSISEPSDFNIKVQKNCENNQENLTLKTDSKTGTDSKQPDLRIKCRILCKCQDLESLNEYFEDVKGNKELTNVAFQIPSTQELSPTNEV